MLKFQERLNEYKRLHTTGKALGIESYVLSPEESKKLYPLMNIDDVYGKNTWHSQYISWNIYIILVPAYCSLAQDLFFVT